MKDILKSLESGDVQARLESSDALADLAEKGGEMEPAVVALGKALADEDGGVRRNVAWTCAFLAEQGLDLSGIAYDLAEVLGDNEGNVQANAAWALACLAKSKDVSEQLEPLFLAVVANGDGAANAAIALGNAAGNPKTNTQAMKALHHGLSEQYGDPARESFARALAEHHLDRNHLAEVETILEHESPAVRHGVLNALSRSADDGVDLTALVPCLAKRLNDEDPHIRSRTAYTIVSLGENEIDIAAALSALGKALSDEQEMVRKECVWAIYCLVHDECDVTEIMPALKQSLDDESNSVRTNSAIPYVLRHLQIGNADVLETVLDQRRASGCFGAAWATTDYCMMNKKPEPLVKVMLGIKPGIGATDQALRQGIAGAIDYGTQRGWPADFALKTVNDLIKEKSDDAVASAALMGIFYKLRQLD